MSDTAPALSGRFRLPGAVVLLLGGLFVGFAPLGLRFSDMEPVVTAFWRFVFGLPMLLVFAKVAGFKITRPNWAAVATGVFFALDMGIWHAALVRTSVANATFIVNLGAISVGLMAWIFLKQRPASIWPVAALLALCGAAAMAFGAAPVGSGNQSHVTYSIVGDMMALIAAVCVSFYLLSATIARQSMPGFSVVFWMTVTSIPVVAIMALVAGENFIPERLADFSAPLWLALFAQCLGQGLIILGMGMTKPSIAGVIVIVQPVVAGLLAWPLFGEALTFFQLAGAVAILIGVWLAGRKSDPPASIQTTD